MQKKEAPIVKDDDTLIEPALARCNKFFLSQKTKDINFRIAALKRF
jgi:hypothetical protein